MNMVDQKQSWYETRAGPSHLQYSNGNDGICWARNEKNTPKQAEDSIVLKRAFALPCNSRSPPLKRGLIGRIH